MKNIALAEWRGTPTYVVIVSLTMGGCLLNLFTYGWNDQWQEAFSSCQEPGIVPARVITMRADRYEVMAGEGKMEAQISGRMRYEHLYSAKNPAVGDWVAIQPNAYGAATIISVLPRTNCLERQGDFGSQVIATNIDKCLLIQALGHDFNPSRLDRYVTMVWNAGITPVVLLTKADTISEEEATEKVKLLESYLPGVDILAVSSLTGYGMDRLGPILTPQTTLAALGSSGVGKSTLLNSLMGGEVMATAEVREHDQRGRHTTTHRQMFLLPSGALYVDTPGMRELGLFSYDALDETFKDIQALAARCRFADCTHNREPDCAVRAAINSGELTRERWKSYLTLKQEERFYARKQILLAKQVASARKKRNKVHYSDYKRGGDRGAY